MRAPRVCVGPCVQLVMGTGTELAEFFWQQLTVTLLPALCGSAALCDCNYVTGVALGHDVPALGPRHNAARPHDRGLGHHLLLALAPDALHRGALNRLLPLGRGEGRELGQRKEAWPAVGADRSC